MKPLVTGVSGDRERGFLNPTLPSITGTKTEAIP
jgi:hypothetical protein